MAVPLAISAIEDVLRGELLRCEAAIRAADQAAALRELEHALAKIEAALIEWREERDAPSFGLFGA